VKLSGDGDNDYINANHVKVSCVYINVKTFNVIIFWFIVSFLLV